MAMRPIAIRRVNSRDRAIRWVTIGFSIAVVVLMLAKRNHPVPRVSVPASAVIIHSQAPAARQQASYVREQVAAIPNPVAAVQENSAAAVASIQGAVDEAQNVGFFSMVISRLQGIADSIQRSGMRTGDFAVAMIWFIWGCAMAVANWLVVSVLDLRSAASTLGYNAAEQIGWITRVVAATLLGLVVTFLWVPVHTTWKMRHVLRYRPQNLR